MTRAECWADFEALVGDIDRAGVLADAATSAEERAFALRVIESFRRDMRLLVVRMRAL